MVNDCEETIQDTIAGIEKFGPAYAKSVKYLHEALYTFKKTYRAQQHEKKMKARREGTYLQLLSMDAFLYAATKPSKP